MEFMVGGHKINVPDDMDVYNTSNRVAGDYDYIAYRGYEITLVEDEFDDSLLGFYANPFGEGENDWTVYKTLTEAREFIDEHPVDPNEYFTTTDPDYRRDAEKNGDFPDRLENLIDDYDPDPGD